MPTQINGSQIKDSAITAAKIAAGANIESSKLADGANWIKRDGSVAFTGTQSMGNQVLSNVGTPGAGGDAANKTYVDQQIAALNSMFDSKGSVRVASTANIVLTNPGTSTFDGVALSVDDRILVKNQSAPAENGIYLFKGSAVAMVRATDFDAWAEIPGGLVAIEDGTQADLIYLSTANQAGTLGSTAITWQQVGAGSGLTSANFVDKETPSGAVNGVNTAYVLANTPTAGSEHVYLNGILQESGGGNDYTISGSTITYLAAPVTGDKIRVSYRK